MGKTKGNNAGKAVAVVLALAVLAGGVCACGYSSRDDAGQWFKNGDFKSWHWSDNLPNTGDGEQNGENVNNPGENSAAAVGGAEISEIQQNGVTVYKAALPRAAFAAMGVSEEAETAYTLTAEVSPDYASDKSLDWSNLAFLDSESEWATGKTVTDYVTVTPNGNSAVLACLQDFGEPIVLTVSSVSNPEVCATCFINYYQRVKSCEFAFFYDGAEVTPTIENGVYKLDYTGAEKDYTIELRPVYSNYTLTDTYTTTTTGALSSTFGYTATSTLRTLAIPAGLTGGEPQDNRVNSLRSALKSYIANMEDPNLVGNEGQWILSGQNVATICTTRGFLEIDGSTHPFYLHVKDLVEQFDFKQVNHYGTMRPSCTSAPDLNTLKARLNSYVAPAYNYYGATVETYNDFVTAVNRCNNSGVGVIEYTITINGAHSNFTTVLSLGYNSEFKTDVQDVTLSDTNVAF